MDYFTKIEEKPKENLAWNIPEQKQGTINIIGGNSQNFKTEIKIAEFLGEKYPIKNVNLVLPDALKKQLPPLENFHFLPSTDSGSFSESQELIDSFNSADFNILLGDLSKNSITKNAIASASKSSAKPLLITRDSLDLIAEDYQEELLTNQNIILLATMPQLIKLLRASYYPKMLLLSQSLIQVAEILHKFTLSYKVSIIAMHNEQILIAKDGQVVAIPLIKSGYSPINFWRGEPAAKIAALNLYNPHDFINATISAIMGK